MSKILQGIYNTGEEHIEVGKQSISIDQEKKKIFWKVWVKVILITHRRCSC